MFENNRKETASKAVTSIWHRNDIEKSTCKTHRYFVDFESRIHVEISRSNRFPRGFAFQNRWNHDELSTWNFDVESIANRLRCVHWVVIKIVPFYYRWREKSALEKSCFTLNAGTLVVFFSVGNYLEQVCNTRSDFKVT